MGVVEGRLEIILTVSLAETKEESIMQHFFFREFALTFKDSEMCRFCICCYCVIGLSSTRDNGVISSRGGWDGEEGESVALPLQRIVFRVRSIVASSLSDDDHAQAVHYPQRAIIMSCGAVEITKELSLILANDDCCIDWSIYEVCT